MSMVALALIVALTVLLAVATAGMAAVYLMLRSLRL
jgi:hypothetical protein